MRELTDRELDSVCGGAFQLGLFSQQIQNRQTNNAVVVQGSGGGFLSGNVAVVGQSNIAFNTNVN
jgi:hypothetical protein